MLEKDLSGYTVLYDGGDYQLAGFLKDEKYQYYRLITVSGGEEEVQISTFVTKEEAAVIMEGDHFIPNKIMNDETRVWAVSATCQEEEKPQPKPTVTKITKKSKN